MRSSSNRGTGPEEKPIEKPDGKAAETVSTAHATAVDVEMKPPKAHRCPDCKTELELYEGENPFKVGQGFCPKCQTRKPLS